jgi:hypothetical protein
LERFWIALKKLHWSQFFGSEWKGSHDMLTQTTSTRSSLSEILK